MILLMQSHHKPHLIHKANNNGIFTPITISRILEDNHTASFGRQCDVPEEVINKTNIKIKGDVVDG